MPGISDYFTQGGGFDDLGILGSAIMAGAYPGTNMGEILMQAQDTITRRRAGRRHEQRLAQQDQRIAQQDQWTAEDRAREQQHRQALGAAANQLAQQAGLPAYMQPLLTTPGLEGEGIGAAMQYLGRGPEKPVELGNGMWLPPGETVPEAIPGYAEQAAALAGAEARARAEADRKYGYHPPREAPISYYGTVQDPNTGLWGQRDSRGQFHVFPNQGGADDVPSGYQRRPAMMPSGLFGGGPPALPAGLTPQPGGPADPAQAARLAQARQSAQQAKPTANERERDDLIKRFGLSDEEATDLANGYMTVTQPDQLGRVFIVNKRLGTSRLAAPKSDEPAGPVASAPERQQPPLAGDVPQATGAVSNLAAIADATIGQLFGGTMFPQTADARERVRLFERSAQEALVNNPKFPVAEQEFIRKMIPTAGDWFANPPTALRNLATFQAYLFDRRNAIDQTLRGGAVSRDEQIRLTDQKASIERVLGMIGTRQSGGGDNMEDPLGIR